MNPSSETHERPAANPADATPASGAVVVRIPGPLRALADGRDEVRVAAGTIAGVLERLVADYPGLRRQLLTEDGRIRDYVNVFVNDDDVRTLNGTATSVYDEDAVTIVPSIAGG
jgi:molybdopterin converting factor small subunit